MFKKIAAASLVAGMVFMSGCASRLDLSKFPAGNLKPAVLATSTFPIQGMVPMPGSYEHMRVYVEGDGHAWATSSQPSTDPTPHTSIMLRFAAEDRIPSAYLARPCQFVMSPNCSVDVWTDSRFGRPEIEAMNTALSTLKSRYAVRSFELIGHSGGGEVALVLAGMRDDVDQVQTIAGNVDPVFWTKLHHLTQLKDPVTPLMYKERLRLVPQRHIVGLKDSVVPPSVSQAYSAQLDGSCLEIAAVDATHIDGYDSVWKRFSTNSMLCKERK